MQNKKYLELDALAASVLVIIGYLAKDCNAFSHIAAYFENMVIKQDQHKSVDDKQTVNEMSLCKGDSHHDHRYHRPQIINFFDFHNYSGSWT